MSISSMTSVAFQRRTDTPGAVPATPADIAAATGEQSGAANATTTTLKVIATYIPTEILTLYLAVVASIQDPARWLTFAIFLVATPTVVWIVYATKVKSSNRPLPISPRVWPYWEMFAATVAYVAWAFALPDTPFSQLWWYSNAVAGIIVLAASTVLGLLTPLFAGAIHAGVVAPPVPGD